ncbi:hypothetical protein FACS189418_8300 [Clostridia bacterium]|nr:hypothetical protein FACS189418_8300 [Clostridia bacterium]
MKIFVRMMMIISISIVSLLFLFWVHRYRSARFEYPHKVSIQEFYSNKEDELEAFLLQFTQNHPVNIYQSLSKTEQITNTYHFNLAKDPLFHLSPEQEQLLKNGEYLSNDPKEDLKKAVSLYTPGKIIHFYDYFSKNPAIYLDSFFLSTNDPKVIDQLKEELKAYGDFKWEKYRNPIFYYEETASYALIGMIFFIAVMEIFFLNQRKKEYTLLSHFGYSSFALLRRPFHGLFFSAGIGICFSIFPCMLLNWVMKEKLLFQMGKILLCLCLLVFAYVILAFSFGYFFQKLQKKRWGKVFLLFSLLAKSLAVFVAFVCFLENSSYYDGLKEQQYRAENWEKTQHFYQPDLRYILRARFDGDYFWKETEKLRKLYDYLESELNGFVFYSGNFRLSGYGEKNWEYDYENQRHLTGESAYGSHGKSVIASPKYFNHNPILDMQGKPVQDSFDSDENTLNIILPNNLRSEEEVIQKDYQENFYQERIRVLEENRIEKENFTIEDVSVNLIYAQDNSQYFTYNNYTGNPRGNLIIDPLVRVYDKKVSDSWLEYWMTDSIFFYLDTDLDVDEVLLPVLEETETIEFIFHFQSIHSKLYETIDAWQEGVQRRHLNLLLILSISLFMVLCVVYFLYERKQKRLSIHLLFGYSFFSLCKNELLWICIPTWILLLLMWLFVPYSAFIFYCFCYVLIDMIMVWLILYYVLNRNIKETIGKEGK